MRCFKHQDKDAVGSCKHCGKGLCHVCLTDLGYGLACRDTHEQEVEAIHLLVTRNTQAVRIVPKTWFVVPTFTAFMGLVFAGFDMFGPTGPRPFAVTMGVGFLIYSAVLFLANRRAFRPSGTQA